MEEVSGQTVFHTHVHIIPRYSDQDELAISFTEHEPNFEQLAVPSQKPSKQLKGVYMKLKNLFWFATGASISYHLVKTAKKSKQR